MAQQEETIERVRNERDQLRSQVEALRPERAELRAAKQKLEQRVAELEQVEPQLRKALETAQGERTRAAEQIRELAAALEREQAARAEAVGLARDWQAKARTALAREEESFTVVQAVEQAAARLINRRSGRDAAMEPPSK